MPPRRAKKAKTSTVEAEGIAASGTTAAEVQTTISGDNGKCKFVEMPLELLLEIMSYFPAVPVPTSRRFNTPVLPPSVFERWDTLRALSQTCRLWRSIFYPMVWERMEACAIRQLKLDTKSGSGNQTPAAASSAPKPEIDIYEFRGDDIPVSWYKGVSRLLEKVSKGLSSDPQAAQHVRTVNVSLTRCSPGTVLPAFVECLEKLPNLETLQILRAHSQMSSMITDYFQRHTFPQIRTVIVPEQGHEILRCCPNARKVICNYGDGSKIITGLAKCCKNIEVVEGITANKNFLKRLVKGCPNIRELKLETGIEQNTTDVLKALEPLKNLTRLEFQLGRSYADIYHTVPLITQIVKGGKSLLDNRVPGKKSLKLFYVPRSYHGSEKSWTLDVPI